MSYKLNYWTGIRWLLFHSYDLKLVYLTIMCTVRCINFTNYLIWNEKDPYLNRHGLRWVFRRLDHLLLRMAYSQPTMKSISIFTIQVNHHLRKEKAPPIQICKEPIVIPCDNSQQPQTRPFQDQQTSKARSGHRLVPDRLHHL